MAEPYETPPSMQDIYDKDKERYSESDRLIEEGDLQGAADVHPDKGELRNNLNAAISGNNNIGGVVTGTALEIGTGYAVDSVTAPLLALGPWGWLGYGISNFSSGVASNYAAQKLRGVEEIGWGELLQSGLIDLVPYFGTQAKGVKSVANVALQSGARTIAGEQLRVGIDEGRALTPSEVAVSGTLGTAIGGAIKATPEVIELGNKLKQQIAGMNPGTFAAAHGTGFGPKPTDIQLNLPFKQSYVPPDASQVWDTNQKLLKYSGLLGPSGRFNIEAYRNILESDQGRAVAMLYSTTPHSAIALPWNKHRKQLVDAFESVYGDAMQQLNIPRSRIEIEHIFTLQQSMPIYDGLSFGDRMFNRVQQAILNRGYKPGNAEDNLMAIPKWIHGQKTNYFNLLHGTNGRGFFTRTIVRKFRKGKGWTQKQADEFRLQTLERYLNEVDEGKRILDEGMTVFDTLFGRPRLPDELVEELADIELGKYSAPELKRIIREIVENFEAKPLAKYTKSEFKDWIQRLDESGDMLEDLTQPEAIRRLQEITGMSLEEIDTRMRAGWFTDLEGF